VQKWQAAVSGSAQRPHPWRINTERNVALLIRCGAQRSMSIVEAKPGTSTLR